MREFLSLLGGSFLFPAVVVGVWWHLILVDLHSPVANDMQHFSISHLPPALLFCKTPLACGLIGLFILFVCLLITVETWEFFIFERVIISKSTIWSFFFFLFFLKQVYSACLLMFLLTSQTRVRISVGIRFRKIFSKNLDIWCLLAMGARTLVCFVLKVWKCLILYLNLVIHFYLNFV